MAYKTLMAHLELGSSNESVLRITGDLAEIFGAAVIGIAARHATPIAYGDGFGAAPMFMDFIEQDRVEIDREIKTAEALFRTALQSRVSTLLWRSHVPVDSLSDYIARQGRSADLIVTKISPSDVFNNMRHVNIGDLIMTAGRPVLIVPEKSTALKLERVLIGWKDSREARSAILNALPLLKMAKQVTVAELAAETELAAARSRIDDVIGWLARHGVDALARTALSTGNDANTLAEIVQELGTDVVVAGAYGHSRLREWVLGGVTRDLILRADCCVLVSH